MTKENELIPYVFQDTGKRVMLRKLSPLLAQQLRKDFPPPKPPIQEVDYGGEKVLEENPAHPEYQQKLAEYEADFNEKSQRLMIKRGVVLNWTEEMRDELADLRQFYMEEYGKELPTDDHLCYVSFICPGSDADLEELVTKLMRRTQPTPEAVDEAQAMFQR